MLEATAVLEFLLGKMLEGWLLVGLLIFNAVVSFLQEQRADAAVELLRQKLAINVRAKRDGEWRSIPARELVPGDLVDLRAGEFVPADIVVVRGSAEVDQSALTGESMEVEKNATESLLSGSMIKKGGLKGTVTATGPKTYYGRTVELIQIAKPKLHIEKVISKVTQWLIVVVAVSLLVGILISVWRGYGLGDIIPLAAILLVSAVPVALPTMFTISMALGALELAKKGALVTRLDASEDAATMDVVCVDKTGTLTMNRLTIADVAPAPGFTPDDVVRYGVLASSEAGGDAIDSAFIADAKSRKIKTEDMTQVDFIPFDPSTRRTEALVKEGGSTFHVMKGAATVILDVARQAATPESWAGRAIADFTARGFRMLAVAKGPGKEQMVLVGLAALQDELRPDSRAFVKDLGELGISTKMLTGDSVAIARQVSTELGLGGNIVRMPDIKAGDGGGESPELVDRGTGFAEIYPEDKFRIVKALQAKGHVVGMTGDGVNDAPALRQAEVGIAVSSATDVAKKASSVVLTREGLGGIDDLVKVGRQIYQRITTWILNKMVRTFKRVVFIISAFILTGLYVVSTLDMIILLFLSDYVTLALSTDNVRYSRKPESWDIRGMIKSGAVLGIIMVFESLAILYAGLYWFEMQADTGRLHTFVLAFLVYSGYFTLLALRERRHFWESRPSAPLAVLMIFNSVLIFILSITGTVGISPISTWEVVFVIIYCFVITLLLNDFIKVGLARRFRVVF